MGRPTTFYDEQFGRSGHKPDDQGTFEKDLVFVVMSFRDDMTDTFAAIREGCEVLRLKAVRVDEEPGSGIVIGRITRLIEQAEFIIVDLTHERPNVYYELGYAHGVGNEAMEILLVAKKGTSLHFDIKPLHVNYYASASELTHLIVTRFREMVVRSRGGK